MKRFSNFLFLALLVIGVAFFLMLKTQAVAPPAVSVAEIDKLLEMIAQTEISDETFDKVFLEQNEILKYQEVILNAEEGVLGDLSTLSKIMEKAKTTMADLIEKTQLAIDAEMIKPANGEQLNSNAELISLTADLILKKISGGNPPELPPEDTCPESNISGYAWSEGIGWIDMCGVSYNTDPATINSSTPVGLSNLTGYAWSSNVGWVQFGNLSSFPVGNSTVSKSSRINLGWDNGNKLSGWAKILALSGNSDTELSTDWADGWISLYGKTADNVTYYGPVCDVNHDGELINATGTCSGYAWGGNVLGWIDFSLVVFEPLPSFSVNLYAYDHTGTQYSDTMSVPYNEVIIYHHNYPPEANDVRIKWFFEEENGYLGSHNCRVTNNNPSAVYDGGYGYFTNAANSLFFNKNVDGIDLKGWTNQVFPVVPEWLSFPTTGSYYPIMGPEKTTTFEIYCLSSYGEIGGSISDSITIITGTCPIGYVLNATESGCEPEPETYVCTNLPSGPYTPATVPAGYEISNDPNLGDCSPIEIIPVVDQCTNIEGDQETVPSGKVKNSSGQCINFRIPYFKEL